ncbi:HEPN/Toprim-associated domain-containing protein [Pantoea stewartii]|uniref:HEPN/Toprim-associated domain-containing protein n=1 Tax=Pantoea stewartii TaxID=66269 RepID=UPI001981077F|nr:HEPN/Toprim-associated domain-containing protein [Pantoea stewartii]
MSEWIGDDIDPTWVGVDIDGLGVEGYQDHYSTWFFKRSDRIRESCERDEHGTLTEKAFIGYRASAATIRRRMALSGYDITACEVHFTEHLSKVIQATEQTLQLCVHDREIFSNRPLSRAEVYQRFLNAIKGTSLQDWLKVLPEAVIHSRNAPLEFSQGFKWATFSTVPLVNAMLSEIPFYTEGVHTDSFNFPCQDNRFFQVAWLACCPDEAVCELDITPLITAGYVEDFRDLDEIQHEETYPHAISRTSIEEIKILSATQPENASLQRMCYASIITAMEAYLGDILKREIFARQTIKERFVASYPAFNERKLKLSDIFSRLARLDSEIRDVVDELSLHKIESAKNIFASTLMAEFPAESIASLGAAIKFRHDIVHRNGRDTGGNLISITHQSVVELAFEVLKFTKDVDAQIRDGLLREHEAEGI